MRKNKVMLQVIGGLMMILLTPAVILTVHTNAFRYNELSGSAQNIANEMLKINGYSLLLAMGLLVLLMIQAKTKFHRKNRRNLFSTDWADLQDHFADWTGGEYLLITVSCIPVSLFIQY